jgi:putative transposase
VAKCYEKIDNQRNDFLHKTANYYIKNYGTIYIEDLNIDNMVKNHYLARSINDSSWGKFFRFLSYKAEEAGRVVQRVDPKGTSQICSRCGAWVEKTLAERTHDCPICGLVEDRDVNSAIDVLQAGQACQALTKEVALCVA